MSPHSGSPSGMIPPKPRLPYAHIYVHSREERAQSQTEALSLDGYSSWYSRICICAMCEGEPNL